MYLAYTDDIKGRSYQIRRTYKNDDGSFYHQLVFDLGQAPEKHFEIYEERTVLFSTPLLSAVEKYEKNSDHLLENLLFDFFPNYIQNKFSDFNSHKNTKFGRLSEQEKEQIAEQLHIFDKKRLYYIRYGAVDQSRLTNLHEKCCRPLIGMSRDEKEFYFRTEERALEPGMYLQYVYAIFDIQKHFTQSFAAWMPEALRKDEMAEHIIEEVCRLNDDRNFWQFQQERTSLHPHLARYLVMFFDYTATPRNYFEDFTQSFQEQHRSFRWPERQTTSTPDEITEIFDLDYDKLKAMSKEELSKVYRKKAMQLHPDQGGDHDQFIKLTEAYQQLRDRIKTPDSSN